MGRINWTDLLVNGDNQTATHITTMKSDISGILNGNITNVNVNGSAAIDESKLAFDTSSGHDHDGSNSKSVSIGTKHFRKGLTLYGDDDTNIAVRPGAIEIADNAIHRATASGDIAIATAGNWVHGSVSASSWVYVYVYNNSGAIGFKLSDEAPDLSDEDDSTAEIPFRYQLYGETYYRCIGCVFVDADGDLCWGHNGSEGLYVSQFDASNVYIVNGLGTGSDQTFNTIWTPKYIEIIYGVTDTSPVGGETLNVFEVTEKMIDTDWYGTALNIRHVSSGTHVWATIANAGGVNAITAQVAGTAGSFTIDAMTDSKLFYAIAYTDLV